MNDVFTENKYDENKTKKLQENYKKFLVFVLMTFLFVT